MSANEPSWDEEEWESAVAEVDQAGARIEAGELEAGRAMVASAAARLAAIVGTEHPDYAQALMIEGDALAAMGRIAEAEARFREALAIHDLYREGDEEAIVRPYRLSVLGRLGYLWSLGGRYAEAEKLLREAIAVAAEVHGEDAPELAEHVNTLGVCLRFAGRYDEARATYERAAALRGTGDEQPASHFHNLSGLASARGDHAEAERWAQRAIETRRRDEPDDGFTLATDLCGLGDALAGQERHTEAESAYREALALFGRSPRSEHPEVAFALHNLADALTAQGRWPEAEPVYRDAIARKRMTLGPESHEVAVTLNNLAAMLAEVGRAEEARRTSAEAVAIVRTALEPEHPVRMGCEALARSLGV